jgi:hypothetical protein
MKIGAAIVALLITLLALAGRSASQDYSSCEYDLDRLRRAARDASQAAADTESECEEYQSCREFPDIYDLLEDGCSSQRFACESARSTLASELSNVESKIRSASISCGYTFELDPQKAMERLRKMLEQQKPR